MNQAMDVQARIFHFAAQIEDALEGLRGIFGSPPEQSGDVNEIRDTSGKVIGTYPVVPPFEEIRDNLRAVPTTAPRPGVDHHIDGWPNGRGYLPPRHQVAQPQLIPAIDPALFLVEHGVTGARLAKLIPQFSRAVTLAYIDEHTAMPPTQAVHIDGVGMRTRHVFQGPGDLELMERVFAARFTPELDWVEVSGL